MKLPFALLLLMLLAVPAHADPFAQGDAKAGKTLLEKSCVACHAAKFGGDGSAIYTRPDRKVKTAQGLLNSVRMCNTNTGGGWFPEDELHVAAYLNLSYYHFK